MVYNVGRVFFLLLKVTHEAKSQASMDILYLFETVLYHRIKGTQE